VLPSIRKRGGYLTPEATEAALTDPDFIIRLATELKTERAARAQLEAQAEADRPKVLFADSVSASRSTILVGEVAKILKGNGV
ncbi:phage antirepressor KilAC domain-containing protein, partial [Escherichia coli]